MKFGRIFRFEPPSDWVESQEGSRLIYSGPNEAYLIVSSAVVESPSGMPTSDPEGVAQLVASARKAVGAVADSPELREVVPLHKSTAFGPLETWFQSSAADAVVFSQAFVVATSGVLIATLESLPSGEHSRVFREFLCSVEALT